MNSYSRSEQLLESFKVSDRFLHLVLAESLGDVSAELTELLSQHSKVKGLKLSEDLSSQNVVDAVELIATAGHVNRNEEVHLLEDTVTESDSQLFDYPEVKLLYLLEIFLRNGVFVEGLLEELIEMGEAQVHRRSIGRVEHYAL